MDMRNLTGSIVALITPFNADKSVDFEALDRLLEFHCQNHTDGILVLGTTGESSTMTFEEDLTVAKFVIDHIHGRIPVIGGAGSNCTEQSLKTALELQKLGADGLLLITPYYNKSNEEGIYQHIKAVVDKTELPSILYNIPGRTGCSFSERNVARLREHPNICGIKEASGSISYATNIAQYLDDDFRMYSGNDDMVVPLLSLGASGVISVWANVAPKTVHTMVDSYLSGDAEGARRVQLDNLELIHALFSEVNPIPVKAALAEMGLIEENYRQPLWPMTDENRKRLHKALVNAQLVKGN